MTEQEAHRAGHDHGREVADQQIRLLGAFPLPPEVIEELSNSMGAYGLAGAIELVAAGMPEAFAHTWRAGFHAGLAERFGLHAARLTELAALFSLDLGAATPQ